MLAVLVIYLPSGERVDTYTVRMMLYAGLTVIALFFASHLTEGTLSPAHVVGIMAFFSLPEAAFPALLWAIFAGGIVGGIVLYAREVFIERNPQTTITRLVMFSAARVTLPFAVAGQIYLSAEGILPLQSDISNSGTTALVILYCFVYVTLYLAIFMLENYNDAGFLRRMLDNDLVTILVILVLPVPFAVLGAEVASQLSDSAEIINTVGVVLIIVGLYLLSQSEQRLRRQLDEMRTMAVITRAMRAHLDLEALLKTLYVQIAHLLGVDNFTVAVRDLENKQLDFPMVMRNGREDTQPAETHRNPLLESVLQNGAPLLLTGDVADQARLMGLRVPVGKYTSWLGVPLMAGGHSHGVLSVFTTGDKRRLNENDLRLLNIIAGSASIAIENAQLYRQQTERANQLSMMNNIGALLSGTLSPESVVDTIISSASTISDATAVAVYVTWEGTLSSVRVVGMSDDFEPPEPMLMGKTPQAPHAITDLNAHDTPLATTIRAEGKQALIELPLRVGEDKFGFIVLYYDAPQTFSGERMELLRSFSSQAAQAIKNARAYSTTDEAFQRSAERLLSLASAGTLLASTVDLKKICELVLTHALETTYGDSGLVALYEDNDLQHMAGDSVDDLIDYIGAPAMQTNAPYIIDSKRLTVPIRRDTARIGYIALRSDGDKDFEEEDAHFVAQIATQAVIAVDNARLFNRISEARDRLQVILDAMEEAIILVDNRGKIVLANPRISMIGLDPSKMLHESIDTLVEDDIFFKRLGFDSAQTALDVLRPHEGWQDYAPELYDLNIEQSKLYIQRYLIPVRDADDQVMGVLIVLYNKTEEQELNNTRTQLSRMIVHDLRSPLTAVTSSLRLLREIIPQDSDYWSVVDTTTDASRRAIRKLLTRVDSLLDISRMESGRMSLDTDIAELANIADSVCVELSPLAHTLDVNIVADISDNVPLLNIDADKIERLLLNLVDNALKYAPAESTVTIRAHSPHSSGADSDAEAGFIRVDVVDQGPGVPDDYKESLFESYVQVEGRKKVRRGVGLGLTFCKLVAEAHGGKIWIEDNPDGGSIFAFTLPTIEAARLPEDTDEFTIEN